MDKIIKSKDPKVIKELTVLVKQVLEFKGEVFKYF